MLTKSITVCGSILVHWYLSGKRDRSENSQRFKNTLKTLFKIIQKPQCLLVFYCVCMPLCLCLTVYIHIFVWSQSKTNIIWLINTLLISRYHCILLVAGIMACQSGSLMSSNTFRQMIMPPKWRSTIMNALKTSTSTSLWRTRYTKMASSSMTGKTTSRISGCKIKWIIYNKFIMLMITESLQLNMNIFVQYKQEDLRSV